MEKAFFLIRHFLNVSMGGDLGRSMLTIVTTEKNEEEIEAALSRHETVVVKGDDKMGFLMKLYHNEECQAQYDIDDILSRNIYVSSYAFREDIWELPEELQKKTIEYAKVVESSKLIGGPILPASDINRTQVVLDMYSFDDNDESKKYFTQISSLYYIRTETSLNA